MEGKDSNFFESTGARNIAHGIVQLLKHGEYMRVTDLRISANAETVEIVYSVPDHSRFEYKSPSVTFCHWIPSSPDRWYH